MAPNTEMKKYKGFKGHKKTQKETAIAKRAAAAEKAKSKKNAAINVKVKLGEEKEMVGEELTQQVIAAPTTKIDITEEEVSDTVLLSGAVDVRDENFAVQEFVPVNHGSEDSVTNNHSNHEECVIEHTYTFDAGTNIYNEAHTQKIGVRDQHISKDTKSARFPTTDTSSFLNQDIVVQQNHLTSTHELFEVHAPSAEIFDVYAHRKALEAALYDNMESPKERLARLSRVKSSDSGGLYDILSEDDDEHSQAECVLDAAEITKRSIDDNRFETIKVHYQSPVQTPTRQSLSVAQLCAAAAARNKHVLSLRGVADNTSVVFPAAAGDRNVRAARALKCIEAGITFSDLHQASEPFVSPAYINFEIMVRKIAAVQPHAISNTEVCNLALDTALEEGSLKLIAMLGTAGPIPANETTPQNSAVKLMSLLGIARSRTTSLESSAQHSRASSLPREDGLHTPLTHCSVSPPPVPFQCSAGTIGYGYPDGLYPPWFSPTMDDCRAAPYSHRDLGFGASLMVSDFFPGQPQYTHSHCWQPVVCSTY